MPHHKRANAFNRAKSEKLFAKFSRDKRARRDDGIVRALFFSPFSFVCRARVA